MYTYIYIFIYLFLYLFVYLFIYLIIHLFIYICVYKCVYMYYKCIYTYICRHLQFVYYMFIYFIFKFILYQEKVSKKSRFVACFPDLGSVLPLPMTFLPVFCNLTVCFSWTSCIVHEILFCHLASAILCFQLEESLRHKLRNRNSKLLQACDFQHQTSCRYVLCPKVYRRESCSVLLASDHLPRVTSNWKFWEMFRTRCNDSPTDRSPGHLPHSSNTLVLASRRIHLANLKFFSHGFSLAISITCLSWNLL